MKRYFFEIAYDGTHFSGWQNQDNARTIQGYIESRLTQLFNSKISILGCGRTDTGVHASQYYFHTDIDSDKFSKKELQFKLNNMLGSEIAIHDIIEVASDAHARFDAVSRSYAYYIGMKKDPFNRQFRYEIPQPDKLDINLLNEAAQLLMDYKAFFPFCKTNSDVNNYDCKLSEASWHVEDNDLLVFRITSNRFLRGMVRLIVGMCINVSKGKIPLSDVKSALDRQERLPLAWSAPGHALFLNAIKYNYI